jgi:hypothetical protein
MRDMRIVSKGEQLELTAKKDTGELILGAVLCVFGVFFLYLVPLAYSQQWSYRFGAVSKASQIFGAVFAAFLGLFCLAGAYYNVLKKTMYRFDLSQKIFSFGDSISSAKGLRQDRLEEVSGIITSSRMLAPGSQRFWVGLLFVSQQKLYFSEYFDRKEDAERLVAALKTHTGLVLVHEKEYEYP